MTYSYDGGNRLLQVVDSQGGTVARSYDGLDRLTQEQSGQGTVNYGYDNASRRSSLTVAGQPAVSYSYDNADRLAGPGRQCKLQRGQPVDQLGRCGIELRH